MTFESNTMTTETKPLETLDTEIGVMTKHEDGNWKIENVRYKRNDRHSSYMFNRDVIKGVDRDAGGGSRYCFGDVALALGILMTEGYQLIIDYKPGSTGLIKLGSLIELRADDTIIIPKKLRILQAWRGVLRWESDGVEYMINTSEVQSFRGFLSPFRILGKWSLAKCREVSVAYIQGRFDEEFFSFDFETNILDTVYRLAHKETSAWMSSSRTRDAGKQPWPLRMITPGVYLVNTPKEIASILYWRGMTDGGMCHIPDVYLESNGERAMAIRGNDLDFYETREFLSLMVSKLRSYAPEAYAESSFSKE